MIYDFVTNTPGDAVASIEWLTIKQGQMASIYLLFDKAHWPKSYKHSKRRPPTRSQGRSNGPSAQLSASRGQDQP